MTNEKKHAVLPPSVEAETRLPSIEELKSAREQAERAIVKLCPTQELMKRYKEMLPVASIFAQFDTVHKSSILTATAKMSTAFQSSVVSKQILEIQHQLQLGSALALPGEELKRQLKEIGLHKNMSAVVSANMMDQVKRFAESVVSRTKGFEEMARSVTSLPPALESYKSSVLYNFLSNESVSNLQRLERLQADFERNIRLVNVEELGAELEVRPDLEREIVEVVQSGRPFSDLSAAALKHFLTFWKVLWDALNRASIIVTLSACLIAQNASIENANSPQQIRQSVHCLSAEQLVFLKGCGVVTRDGVIVRAKATRGSKEILRLPAKTMIEVLGTDSSGWVHISVEVGDQDISGWISERYLLVY